MIFGRVASIVKTHAAYEVPPVIEADYNPADLPAGMELSPANRRDMWIEANSKRKKACDALAEESPRFYRAIWTTLAQDSRSLVLAQPNYDDGAAWGTNERPNELWAALRLTHFTQENAGDGAGMAVMNCLAKMKTFERFHQRAGVSVHEFKKEFVEQLTALEAAGMDVEAQPIKAARFLEKLDCARYGDMMITLRNQMTSMGGEWPQTVEAAYSIARTWVYRAGAGTAAVGIGDAHHDVGTYLLFER